MTNRAFLALLDDLHDRESNLLGKKAQTYSTEQDRMHNFNKISNITGQKPPLVAFYLLMKHFIALQDWLLSYNSTKYDGITIEEFKQAEEFILDIRNYLALIYAMLYENIEPEE